MQLEWISNEIPANSFITLVIVWNPIIVLSKREILQITDNRNFKKDVAVILKSIDKIPSTKIAVKRSSSLAKTQALNHQVFPKKFSVERKPLRDLSAIALLPASNTIKLKPPQIIVSSTESEAVDKNDPQKNFVVRPHDHKENIGITIQSGPSTLSAMTNSFTSNASLVTSTPFLPSIREIDQSLGATFVASGRFTTNTTSSLEKRKANDGAFLDLPKQAPNKLPTPKRIRLESAQSNQVVPKKTCGATIPKKILAPPKRLRLKRPDEKRSNSKSPKLEMQCKCLEMKTKNTRAFNESII